MSAAGIIDGILDAAVNIWSATRRCDPKFAANVEMASQQHPGIKCEIDITSSISSVTGVIDNVINMLQGCHAIQIQNPQCALAAGDFVSGSAGLAAGVGAAVDHCSKNPAKGDYFGRKTDLGKCFADTTGTLKNLLQGCVTISHAAQAGTPADRALHIVSVLGNLGASVANAINDCSADIEGNGGKGNQKADCAGAALSVVANLNAVGRAGDQMATACKVEGAAAQRLFLFEDLDEKKADNSLTSQLALAAFLPVAAAMGFVVGRRFQSRQGQVARELVDESECELVA
jgi:hypothetical protein